MKSTHNEVTPFDYEEKPSSVEILSPSLSTPHYSIEEKNDFTYGTYDLHMMSLFITRLCLPYQKRWE